MCFVDFSVWAKHGWKQKGTRVAQRKNRGQGWKRITSRDRWCILADSRNPFHAQMKAVWEGECVCSVCMMGVAGQGLGLLVSGGREGTFCNPNQCSYSLINDPKPKGNPSYCNNNTINKPIMPEWPTCSQWQSLHASAGIIMSMFFILV